MFILKPYECDFEQKYEPNTIDNTVKEFYNKTINDLESYQIYNDLHYWILTLPLTDKIIKLVNATRNIMYTKDLKYDVCQLTHSDMELFEVILLNSNSYTNDQKSRLLNVLFTNPELLFNMSQKYGIDILKFIHKNRLAISNLSYFLILIGLNCNNQLSDDEITEFNNILQISYQYLPDIIQDIVVNWCVFHNYRYKLEKIVDQLHDYTTHVNDENILTVLLESGNKVIINLIMKSILFNSFKKSYIEYMSSLDNINIDIIKILYRQKYLTDEYVLETMNKFSLDVLQCLLHFNFKYETLNELRQYIIKKTEYNYFNSKDWRMISNETKINYLKDFFQVEDDGTVVAYLLVNSNNKFKIRANGDQLIECNNDYYNIDYSPYHIDYTIDYNTYEHPVDIETLLSAYNHIKNGKNIIEVLVNIMDILEIHSDTLDKISFGATRFEFGDYPTSTQLSSIICEKYKVTHPKYVKLSTKHIEVDEDSELLKFKMNSTVITHNINVNTFPLKIEEFTTKLIDILKKINQVSEYKYKYVMFVYLGNIIMNNSLLILKYPELLKNFIIKRDEFISIFPNLIDFNVSLGKLKNYVLEHEIYYMNPTIQQIFNIKIKNEEENKIYSNNK
jgi:hypothetical protein